MRAGHGNWGEGTPLLSRWARATRGEVATEGYTAVSRFPSRSPSPSPRAALDSQPFATPSLRLSPSYLFFLPTPFVAFGKLESSVRETSFFLSLSRDYKRDLVQTMRKGVTVHAPFALSLSLSPSALLHTTLSSSYVTSTVREYQK